MENVLAVAANVEVLTVILEGNLDNVRSTASGNWQFLQGVES